MHDSQETAAFIDVEASEVPENKLQRRTGGSLMQTEMSPEGLRQEIARQSEMRGIMTEYVRGQMKEDHHWYRFNDAGKPALTKDGGYLICGLFKATPGETKMEIIREEGGHFTVVSRAVLYNINGVQIASGNGSCTTREVKYAYRWVKESELPIGFNKSDAVTREGWAFKNQLPEDYDFRNAKTREVGSTKKYTQYATIDYRVPNKDLADLENTVIKMSNKRAFIAAVQQLPLVSELFATDPEGGKDDEKTAGKSKPAASAPRRQASSNNEPPTSSSTPSHTGTNVDSAVNLAKKLLEHGVDEEALAMQFLPEGVAKFSDLTDEQAAAVLEPMSTLLNAKLAEKKNGGSSVV